MTHLTTGVSDPLRLLRDVKQFLFFIEHRLHVCDSAEDAREILPDLDAALLRLDQAMAQVLTDGRGSRSANLTRPVPQVRGARSRRSGRR